MRPSTGHGRTARPARGRGADPVEWRRERLLEAGFPRGPADRLARDSRYDLHLLIELVERGAPPELATRILAPLNEGRPW